METFDAPLPPLAERDGDVAVVVFDHPPLNLFHRADVLNALEHVAAELQALTDPCARRRVRVRCCSRREARSCPVASTSRLFQARSPRGPEPARRGADLWSRVPASPRRIEDLPPSPRCSPRTGSPCRPRSSWP